jgi:hypothetical protein
METGRKQYETRLKEIDDELEKIGSFSFGVGK